MTRKLKNAKGITLIALVITVVIMLILASVTINLSIGERGIITRAKNAKIQIRLAEIKESIQTDLIALESDNMFAEGLPSEDVVEILEKYGDVIYSVPENATTTPVGVIAKDGETTIGEIRLVEIYDIGVMVSIPTPPQEQVQVSDADTWTKTKTVTLPIDSNGDYDTVWGESINSMEPIEGNSVTVNKNGEYFYSYSDGVNHGRCGTVTITKIDNTAPTVSELVASEPTTDGFTLAATATDEGSGIATYNFYIKESGTEGDYLLKSTSNSSYTVTGLEAGTTYSCYVVATDNVNNASVRTPIEDITVTTLEPPYEAPRLAQGMVPVKWADTNSDSVEDAWVVCSTTDPGWCDYSGSTSAAGTDYTASKWANVMLMDGLVTSGHDNSTIKGYTTPEAVVSNLKDETVTTSGSMFVWIPRYEYKINKANLGYTNTGVAVDTLSPASDVRGSIDVHFIPTTTKSGTSGYTTVANDSTAAVNGFTVTGGTVYNSSTGYIIHPAFINNVNAGGWDSELPGIWVAKFEASAATQGTTTAQNPGDNSIGYSVRIIQDKQSWRNNKIGNMYTVCQQMRTRDASLYGISESTSSIDPHLMKNSEWGAVAYLTHSQYGRNGNKISRNTSSGYWTGQGNPVSNTNQSSTGNVTGIYDLSGGAYEYVAAFTGEDRNNLENSNGSSFASISYSSSKYATRYESIVYTPSYSTCKTGDATYEVCVNNGAAWFSEGSECASSNNPFFMRGGMYNTSSAGVFFSSHVPGAGDSYYGFRPVLVVQ